MDQFSAIAGYLAADAYRERQPPAPPLAAPPAVATIPPATDAIVAAKPRNLLADVGSGTSFLAGIFGAGAGIAESAGREDIALGLAAAAGVAGAVGGIGEFIDHLRERNRENVASPLLNDTAAATGAVAGTLGAGAGIAALVPGYGHAAIGLGVLAGLSGAVDGVLDVIDHRKNEEGFSGKAPKTRDWDSATNGIAGTLGAMAHAVPGGPAIAGIAVGIQGVAHIAHRIYERSHAPEHAATENGIEALQAALPPSAGGDRKMDVVG
jgi:hypothetical protein